MSDERTLPTLLPRLRAIAKRDLADRTISPGEALDLVELILATRAYVETLDTDGVADDDDLRDALAVIGAYSPRPKPRPLPPPTETDRIVRPR